MPETFVYDLSRTSWRPAGVQELAAELGRAFEASVGADEVEFVGCELGAPPDAPDEVLDSDAAVRGFCEPSGGGSSVLAKMIRVELPEKVVAELRKPRKLALLASGKQLSKFSGVLPGSDVELAMKFFECGHFRTKETAPGASGSPSTAASSAPGAISEGRWEETEDGVIRLEFLVRFHEASARRRSSDGGASTYELVPVEERSAELRFDDNSQDRLAGDLPTALGGASSGPRVRVELHAEASTLEQQRQAQARQQADDDEEEYRHLLREVPVRRPPPQPPKQREWEDDWDSDEPRWPMYLGIVLFVVVILTFAWVWYEETYSPESAKEFEEL